MIFPLDDPLTTCYVFRMYDIIRTYGESGTSRSGDVYER